MKRREFMRCLGCACAFGNHCAGCGDFQVLTKNDDAFRRQVAAGLTKEVGREVLPAEV